MIDIEVFELIFQTDLIKDICDDLNIKTSLIDIDIIMDEDKFDMLDETYRIYIMNKNHTSLIYKINILLFKCRFMNIHEFIKYIYDILDYIKQDYTSIK